MDKLQFVSNVTIANTLLIPSEPLQMFEAICNPKIESAIEITLSVRPDSAMAVITAMKLIIDNLPEVEDGELRTAVSRFAAEVLGAVDTAINQR